VAPLTLRRRGFEVHIDQTCFLVGRFMTIHACGGPMRTRQREGSPCVIETRQLFP
jgi:hypothetical protein